MAVNWPASLNCRKKQLLIHNYLVSRPVLWQVSWWDPPKTLKNIHINSDWVTKHGNATDVANKLSQFDTKMDMFRTRSTYK
jgi:hypothetical protein